MISDEPHEQTDESIDFGQYGTDRANLEKDQKWELIDRQIWEDAQAALLAELAAKCDPLCDCRAIPNLT